MTSSPNLPAVAAGISYDECRSWRSDDRWLAATCLVVCAGTHIPLIPEHLEEAPYAGVAFVLLVVTASALAVLVLLRDTAAVWAMVAGVNVLAVAAYVLTRTVALPQLADDVGSWTEPLSFPALGSELLAVAVVWSAWQARRSSRAGAHGGRDDLATRDPRHRSLRG
ncbi:hypothetical protein [Nocardioides ultimimeridianus]